MRDTYTSTIYPCCLYAREEKPTLKLNLGNGAALPQRSPSFNGESIKSASYVRASSFFIASIMQVNNSNQYPNTISGYLTRLNTRIDYHSLNSPREQRPLSSSLGYQTTIPTACVPPSF